VKKGHFTNAEGVTEPGLWKYCVYRCPVRSDNMQWFLSAVPDGTDPGTSKDVDFFYQHHDRQCRSLMGTLLPPVQWHPYIKHGVLGAGRTATSHEEPPFLSMDYRWANPELDRLGGRAYAAAATAPAAHAQPSSGSSMWHGGGGGGGGAGVYHHHIGGGGGVHSSDSYNNSYNNNNNNGNGNLHGSSSSTPMTFDDDELYGESKAYDDINQYSRD
jgi:hypothetical protein